MDTIGGCREYTGAPYFASMTCLRVSCMCSVYISPHPHTPHTCQIDMLPDQMINIGRCKAHSNAVCASCILPHRTAIRHMTAQWLCKLSAASLPDKLSAYHAWLTSLLERLLQPTCQPAPLGSRMESHCITGGTMSGKLSSASAMH